MTTTSTETRRDTTNAAPLTGHWMEEAVCRTTDAELFFPVGTTGPAIVQTKQAKAVCMRCPVRPQCLSWALETRQDFGVLGGLSEEERSELHGRRLKRASEDGRSSVDVILEDRLDEYQQLEAQDLTAWEIGRKMRTNAQTIYNVRDALAQQAGVSV